MTNGTDRSNSTAGGGRPSPPKSGPPSPDAGKIEVTTAIKGLLMAATATLVIGIAIGMWLERGSFQTPQPEHHVMSHHTCQELAQTAGYESNYTSDGTCWLKLEHDIVIPYDAAIDLLKFKYQAAETDKLARLENIRQDIAYNRRPGK